MDENVKPDGEGKTPMSEEDKKKKFGDKYDPDFRGKEKKKKSTQDWEWYALTEEIAKSIGNFSYSDLTGVPKYQKITKITSDSSGNPSTPTSEVGIWNAASIMRIEYVNAYLTNGESYNALNKAATQLYVYLRHVNSGARNYEAADLFMLIGAMREIYSDFLELKRAIGFVSYYNFYNRSIPTAFLRALGFNETELIANLANYRARLNVLAEAINSVAIPKYFKAFDRSILISSAIFADSDSMRGQFYAFVKRGSYEFDTTTETTGTSLQFKETKFGDTFAQKLTTLENKLQYVLTDTDANTISGDVLHAFSDSEVYHLSQIPEDYTVSPEYIEDVSAQIENAVSLSAYHYNQAAFSDEEVASLNVTQQNGQIIWQPVFTLQKDDVTRYFPEEFLFNSHKDQVDYKNNLEWSRLIAVCTPSVSNSETVIKVDACGLELVFNFKVYDSRSTSSYNAYINQNLSASSTDSSTIIFSALTTATRVSQFDWHPTIYVFQNGDPDTIADIKKYVWLSKALVSSIHDAANNASFTSNDLYNMKRK